MATRRIVVLYEDRILAEYETVLARPRFRFAPAEVHALLEHVTAGGERVLSPPLPVTLPNPDDLPFLEVAITGSAAALVTDNVRHFFSPDRDSPVEVLPPAELIRRWVS